VICGPPRLSLIELMKPHDAPHQVGTIGLGIAAKPPDELAEGAELAPRRAEAFAIGADRWSRDGIPTNPRAWLMRTAWNRATDRIRRERVLAAKFAVLVADQAGEASMHATSLPDERLELIFTCCHPGLALEVQVALTLRAVGGLTVREIARGFLAPERTMAQRLVRAKRQIKCSRGCTRSSST
jgi:predicted RNA polymerase sigma factor